MDHPSPEQWCYLVGIGSNLPTPFGSSEITVKWALKTLGAAPNFSATSSRIFRSPAFPSQKDPEFVNAAARVLSPLPPNKFLMYIHEMESRCGRERSHRWAPRTLDVDILACDGVILPDSKTLHTWMAMGLAEQQIAMPAELLLPHPRLHQRGFVLLPLQDVAGDWRHPILGKNVTEMIADLTEAAQAGIVPL